MMQLEHIKVQLLLQMTKINYYWKWVFVRACGKETDLVELTHWGRVTHRCVGNLTIIGSDNGLSPGRRQAITWTNVWILSIGPLGTNFSEILIEIHTFSFKKIHLKMSSGKWRPFCLGLNVLRDWTKSSCRFLGSHQIISWNNNEFLCQHNGSVSYLRGENAQKSPLLYRTKSSFSCVKK